MSTVTTRTDDARFAFDDLRSLIAPRRVAVVGANDDLAAFTGGTIHNLLRHGFDGDVYPVNPRRDEVQGLPCFPSLHDLPEPVDSVVVVVRGDLVVDVLTQARDAGARSAIVISAGFGEGAAGEVGRIQAAALEELLDRDPMPVLGPNTTGLVHLNDRYVPRAVANQLAPPKVRPGPLALLSQSGAANNVVYNRAQSAGLGVGLAVATGVQLRVDLWDLLSLALDDDRLEVIALLAEQLGDPDRYVPLLVEAQEIGKPIVVLKTGRSDVGRRAVETHSGSLAGNWALERALLDECGVAIADDLDQLWEVSQLFARWGRPRSTSFSLGAVAFSGGEGALLADQASAAGIDLPDTGARFAEVVAANLTMAAPANPFDPSGELLSRPKEGLATLRSFIEHHDFDATLFAFAALDDHLSERVLPSVLSALRTFEGRIAISSWRIPGLSDRVGEVLAADPLPVFDGSHRAVAALDVYRRAARSAPKSDLLARGSTT
jgi:acetate---CoA ligase (ADP-forming)